MRSHRRLGTALLALPLLVAAAACAPADDAPSASGSASPSASLTPGEGDCAPVALGLQNPGQLTVGTDSPAYEP